MASFPTTPLLDPFNATENPISRAGGWSNKPWQFNTSNLEATASGGAFSVTGYGSAAWIADVFSDCEAYVNSPSSGDCYIACRIPIDQIGGFANGYALTWVANSVFPISIYRYISGSNVTIGSYDPSPGQVNVGDQMGIRAHGNEITAWWNGVPIIAAHDEQYVSGYLGIETNLATLGTGFMNFGGGSFTGAPLLGMAAASQPTHLGFGPF